MVPALNRRAMEWCIANDLTEAAIAYGHAAGETDTVAGLVDALALPLYNDGRMETLDEWLAWFDDDELRQYPALAVEGAWLRALTGRPAEAERWLALADGATSRIPLSDGTATIEPWIANLRACMMPLGVEQAIADGDLALDRLSPESGWRPSALLVRGMAHAVFGAAERATDDLMAAIETGLAVRLQRRRLPGLRTARASRGQAGRVARGGATRARRHRLASTSGASAITRPARSCT